MCNQLSLKIESNSKYQDKFRGAFIGAAIGDALGFITEFMRSPTDIRTNYNMDKLNRFVKWERITTYRKKGQYIRLPLPPGTYSDDTQLTLATARSIEANGSFNPNTFSKFELPLWLEYELGGGSGTKAAARNLQNQNINWHNNFYKTKYNNYVDGGGNGAAMRILPIALINLNNSSRRYLDIWRNTIITHGHPRGLMGAILLADAIRLLIDNPPTKIEWLDQLIENCFNEYPQLIEIWNKEKLFYSWEQQWNKTAQQNFEKSWNDICQQTVKELKSVRNDLNSISLEESLTKLGCYDRKTKGAGDSTVIAAILFICKFTYFSYDSVSNQFEEVIVAIVNQIGIDTDTIAYFAGAMIGVQYGIKVIPEYFKKEIQDFDYLLKVANWCHKVYLNSENLEKIFIYPEYNNSKEYLKGASFFDKDFTNKQSVNTSVFGNAKILKDVDITPDGLGKYLHWLHIKFEFGQTICLKIESYYSVNTIKKQTSSSIREESVVSSLPVLDEYKKRVETSNFDSDVIVNILKEMKFEKENRAIYNAFATWLWTALPSNTKSKDASVE